MPSLTPPPSHLDDDQIERLAELLDQRAVPFKGFNLEALDGFLSALVVSPSLVMPSEWQPVVWGGKPPTWADEEEAFQVQTLLTGWFPDAWLYFLGAMFILVTLWLPRGVLGLIEETAARARGSAAATAR